MERVSRVESASLDHLETTDLLEIEESMETQESMVSVWTENVAPLEVQVCQVPQEMTASTADPVVMVPWARRASSVPRARLVAMAILVPPEDQARRVQLVRLVRRECEETKGSERVEILVTLASLE